MFKYYEALNRWKYILVLFILLLLFSFAIFPFFVSDLGISSASEFSTMYTKLCYDAEWAINYVNQIGQSGRESLIFITQVLDTIYPIIYGLLFVCMFRVLNRGRRNIKYVYLVPIITVLVDFIENYRMVYMFKNIFLIDEAYVEFTSIFTSTKWILVAVNILIVIIIRKRVNPS
jgi:hypothetical protein